MDQPLTAPTSSPPRRRWALTFSLRTLMLVVLLIAVFLGGRASVNWKAPFIPKLAGNWIAAMPAGHRQPTTLRDLGGGQFLLSSRAIVFNGTYQWESDNLVMVKPAHPGMVGLTWKWDGKRLLLVGEPAKSPTGSNYVGTALERSDK